LGQEAVDKPYTLLNFYMSLVISELLFFEGYLISRYFFAKWAGFHRVNNTVSNAL